MSKRRSKKTFPEEGRSFIKLTREMLTSDAWQNLSDKGRLAYVNIRYNFFGNNPHDIICPFSSLVNPMAPATWARATRELCEHGFITFERQSRGWARLPTIYGLSNNWHSWGTDKFISAKINTSKDPDKGFSKLWKENPERMIQIRKQRIKK